MKFVIIFAVLIFAYGNININANPSTQRPPKPSDINSRSTATGRGSYWEYAVRNIMQNIFYFPFVPTENGIHENEQMLYYYHLQLMHIDMLWLENWMRETENPRRYPDFNELPSRAVRFHYNYDVPYVFEDGRQRTLESHHLQCEECNRQFQCNVNNLHNHFAHITEHGGSLLPVFVDSNDALNQTQLGNQGPFSCAAPSVRFTAIPTTSTEDPFLPHKNNIFKYEVLHDEFRRRLVSDNNIQGAKKHKI